MREAVELFSSLTSKTGSMQVVPVALPRFLDCAARLLDREPSLLDEIRHLLNRLAQPKVLAKTNRQDSAHLDLAEGVLAFREGRLKEALDLFDLARQNADRVQHEELMLTTRYYLTKAHYKSDRNREALQIARSSRERIPKPKFPKTAALISMLEAWMVFLCGDVTEARKILRIAESALWGSDYIENANLLSFKARIARKIGHFNESVELEQEAIDQFPSHVKHPTLTRCHAQKAFSLLLQAASLHRQGVPHFDREVGILRQQAYESIMAAHPESYRYQEANHRGMGRVHYVFAYYYHDLGEMTKALAELGKALFVARKFSDRALEINSMILQTRCAGTVSVEQAKQILDYADRTDNRRLKIRSRICLGTAFIRDKYRNLSAAQTLLGEARIAMLDSDQDYLRIELDELEQALRATRADDDRLLEITRTLANERKLDEIITMVEESVVGAVWLSCGQVTIKTAAALGTTRRRVRRILDRSRKISRLDSPPKKP